MPRSIAWRTAAATALVALLAACGTPAQGPAPRDAEADDVVLRVEELGGFVPEDWHLTSLPAFTLYGDGRIITEGPQIAIYPPPAIPNLQVRTVTAAAMQKITEAAVEAGLDESAAHETNSNVADASTTRFVFVDEAGTHTVTAYALGIEGEDTEARRKLAAFREKIGSLETWIDEDELGEEQSYEFTSLRVYARPVTAGEPEPEGGAGQAEWPLGDGLGDGEPVEGLDAWGCTALTGADMETVVEAAGGTNRGTRWTSGGEEYLIALRPLLPEESGC